MIPQELINEARWCVWKREVRGGKPTKVPYNPRTLDRAETNNPDTFSTFKIAEEAYHIEGDIDGIGILVSNGFSAVDIDHCIENGELSELAKDICAKFSSYTEKSPSGTGLRIIIRGDTLAYDRKKYYLKNPNNGVEFYISGMTNRFMTMTGNTLHDLPIRRVTHDELTDFLEQYMNRKINAADTLSDEQIIEKASRNAKFEALFKGDMTSYNNDHSSADLALCNILAFWTNKNPAQIDSIFRKSGLYRDKWLRDDYRNSTINFAISQCATTYDPLTARKIMDKLDAPIFNTGDYTITDAGVTREVIVKNQTQTIHVTSTPIVPVAYLENLDQSVHKVELHYILNGRQKTLVVEREIIANKNKIISLANQGIDVTSATANELVNYLATIARLNTSAIVHHKSVARVGWVGNDFVPYNDSIKFDGAAENRHLFTAISQAGDYNEWVNFMRPLRKNIYLRLMMAASFASPLIERVNGLPFVFHLWGETGKGKTVALMVAMSIWGDPRAGKLTRTMNMTNAAMMSASAFLYNLPFAGDELQTIKELNASYDKLIMQITEGIERGRMQYSQNLQTRSWKCAFLFTGEERCTNDKSGGGTQNRVFEVEFRDTVVEDGASAVRFIAKNYGHAGKHFIEYVKTLTEPLTDDYDKLIDDVKSLRDTTDKQAATAALILLADKLACESIFTSETPLSAIDVIEFVKTNEEVTTSKRAYDYIVDWIAVNDIRFRTNQYGEVWGILDYDSVFIIDTVLNSALENAGFSFDAVKKDWADKGLLVKYHNKFKKRKTICGVAPYCVEIKLPEMNH